MTAAAKPNLSDPITWHMRTDFARLNADQTVGQALAELHAMPPPGRIIYFYVVDQDNRLQGVVPTRRLLLSPAEKTVSEIMVGRAIAIPRQATLLDACEFFIQHRLLAYPVVDEERRLIGVVDAELYTSELEDLERSQRSGDLFQLIGVHLSAAQQASPVQAFRHRFPWLLTNIAGGVLAAFISGFFEAQLQRVVALALFIPVVLAVAESVSIQSVSLALEVLHERTPTLKTLFEKLASEVLTGLFLGTASGLAVGLVALVWLGQGRVVLCLLGGIAGGVTCAAVFGAAIPIILRLLQREPQVAAGPIALAATDMVTLLFYFSLARVLFG